MDEIEKAERDQKIVPKRRILKQNNFTEYNKETFNPNLLDGFYLVYSNTFFFSNLFYFNLILKKDAIMLRRRSFRFV